MPRSVWIISELYYPEETSTGYFLTRISEGVAEHYPVKVLCGQPSYAERGVRAPAREVHHGVTIQRCPSTTLNKDVLLFRIANLVTISFSTFLEALRQVRRNDCLLAVTNPPLLPFLMMAACRLRGAEFLLLVHDVYPEVLMATGVVDPRGVVAHLLGWATRRLYGTAVRIIVLGRDMEKLVSSRMRAYSDAVVIIPNWADLNEILVAPRSQNRLLRELNLTTKFVVQYSGNMGRTHGLECLLEAAIRLNRHDDIHFLFIGSGAKKPWLERAALSKRVRNVTILPPGPRRDLASSLNACDVAIISFVPGMAGVSVPSRMYNIMAAGKPIIAVADDNSELALVVREESIGWVVPPDQPDKVAEAVLEARAHPELLKQMGRRARLAAEKKYSFEKAIDSYVHLVASLDEDRPQ